MNNKKLLKFILKDLSELEELITDKSTREFDELEWEFLQTRVGGAKRMIGILMGRENAKDTKNEEETKTEIKESAPVEAVQEERLEKIPVPKSNKQEIKQELKNEEEKATVIEREEEKAPEHKEEKKEQTNIENPDKTPETIPQVEIEKAKIEEVELTKKETDEKRPTLGDSFSKEKSINDLVDSEKTNLEQKLSNRPVNNIKTSIGINDRFQFIRELFDGNADTFSKAVAELDNKRDIKEAVEYLQTNFKWKKNETSLKFVNLVKRRFSND